SSVDDIQFVLIDPNHIFQYGLPVFDSGVMMDDNEKKCNHADKDQHGNPGKSILHRPIYPPCYEPEYHKSQETIFQVFAFGFIKLSFEVLNPVLIFSFDGGRM